MITWSTVEDVLDTLNAKNPSLFSRSLLIGGWSALLYHRQLVSRKHPSFPAPAPDSLDKLLSKDIDFTHVWRQDFYDSYPDFIVRPETGSPFLEINGLRIGFAQVGVTFDPDEAFEKSRIFTTARGTPFATLDPVRLFREKQALIQKQRGKANDVFHFQIAEVYARYEWAEAVQAKQSDPTKENEARLDRLTAELRDLAPELLPT